MTDTRTVHDGFNKEVWITEYDKASYEHAWFQLMKEGTPEVEHNPAGADLPNGETGLVGRLINTGYGRPD